MMFFWGKVCAMKYRAFTLIELLIVVAVIAILAAIAVPNFLEAQTRSRVSRAQNDMRTIALAMEAYLVDNGGYPARQRHSPLGSGTYSSTDKNLLTTPISYLDNVPGDIFRKLAGYSGVAGDYRVYATRYSELGRGTGYPLNAWMTWSYGPDLTTNQGGYKELDQIVQNESLANPDLLKGIRYDPTNGTISIGDIHRFSSYAMQR
jgi:prepilin-type N-terminal cleavage/methylation domain-containing protein